MIGVNEIESYKPVPNQKDHGCFGCSPVNLAGLQLKFYTDEKSVFTHLRVPRQFAGWQDVIHGGILATILDETTAWTAIYLLQRYILTKNLNIDFKKPVKVDQELRAFGQIEEVLDEREARVVATIYDESNDICSQTRGNLRIFTPAEIRERGVLDENYLESFEKEVFI